MKAKFPMDVYKLAIERIQFWPSFSTIAFLVFSFPCSSVGMHTIWVPTPEHGNQANSSFQFLVSSRERLHNIKRFDVKEAVKFRKCCL